MPAPKLFEPPKPKEVKVRKKLFLVLELASNKK
jgi:hypothetical protein